MAKVLNQTGLISTWHDDAQQHHRKISLLPKTRSFNYGVSCSARRFPSLKVKSLVLRSSSFTSSEFNGKRLVVRELKRFSNGGNSPFRSSTAVQVGNSRTISLSPISRWFWFTISFSEYPWSVFFLKIFFKDFHTRNPKFLERTFFIFL